MCYIIKSFDRTTGQIEVEFTELGTRISIDVPIQGSSYMIGEELDRYIKGFIPEWAHQRKKQLAAGIDNEDYFIKLLNKSEEDLHNEKCNDVRRIRDMLLLKSDWVLLPDTGFTEPQIQKFKDYRQKLRDVPQQSGFPDDIEWPSTTGEWPNNPDWK